MAGQEAQEFSITQIRGESTSTKPGNTSSIRRASVINSRPRWRTISEHILFATVGLNPSLHVHLSRPRPPPSSRARSRKFVRRWRWRQRDAGIVSGDIYTRVVAVKISFLFPSCARQRIAISPCLHTGRGAWLIYRVSLSPSVFAGFPGKSVRRRPATNGCVLTLRWRAFKSSGFDGTPDFLPNCPSETAGFL